MQVAMPMPTSPLTGSTMMIDQVQNAAGASSKIAAAVRLRKRTVWRGRARLAMGDLLRIVLDLERALL
jgi:hypothetical protein